MPKGYYVIGTDYGVGKTVVAAGIAGALIAQGLNVGVMKPIATGAPLRDGLPVSLALTFLLQATGLEADPGLVNPFSYATAGVPSVVGRLENLEVNLAAIEDRYFQLSLLHDYIVIDGCGGLMTPINQEATNLDLALHLSAELIVVTGPGLGAINHTLLTVCHARQMGCPTAGIVINGFGKTRIGLPERTNPDEITRLSGAPLLGILPWLDGVNLEELSMTGLVDQVDQRLDLDLLTGDDRPEWTTDLL